MKEHNFERVTDKRTRPGFQRWWCKDCDSIVEFIKKLDTVAVNRLMANKLACLPPVGAKIN